MRVKLPSKLALQAVAAVLIVTIPAGIALTNQLTSKNTAVVEDKVISDNYYNYTPARFNQSLNRSQAVVVNFYANWCNSCSEMEPAIRDVLSELSPKQTAVGFKVNYGDSEETGPGRELAQKYGVTMQSTVVVLSPDGQPFKTFFSKVSAKELKDTLIAASLVA